MYIINRATQKWKNIFYLIDKINLLGSLTNESARASTISVAAHYFDFPSPQCTREAAK